MPPFTSHNAQPQGALPPSAFSRSPKEGLNGQYHYPLSHHPRSNKAETQVTSFPVQETPETYLDNTAPITYGEEAGTAHIVDLASPQFSFENYLTPEATSEENYAQTTPEIEDLMWQESYNDGTFNGLEQREGIAFSDHSNMPQYSLQPDERHSHRTSIQNHLPSPQLTATPTPPLGYRRIHQPSDLDSSLSSPAMAFPPAQQRAASPEDGQFYSNSGSYHPQIHDSETPGSHLVSPVIWVSSHPRGDSPARAQTPVRRSLSRSSRRSRLAAGEQATGEVGYDRRDLLQAPRDHDQPSWDDDEEDNQGQRTGLGPAARDDQYVPSLKDMAQRQEIEHTIDNVQSWLAKTDISENSGDGSSLGARPRTDRVRSRSTGARTNSPGRRQFPDKHLPGPGALLDVESNHDYSEDEEDYHRSSASHTSDDRPPSPPAQVDPIMSAVDDDKVSSYDEIPPELAEPLPRQFYRRTPWQDAVRYAGAVEESEKSQPLTANAAMVQFQRQAVNFETASRAATWGTGRRASESEIGSIMEARTTRHHSLSQKARDRRSSVVKTVNEARNRVRGMIPRRSTSNAKKVAQQLTSTDLEPRPTTGRETRQNSLDSPPSASRVSSWGKPQSPQPSTSDALRAITGQLAVVGGGNSGSGMNLEVDRPRSPFRQALKRVRSKSDIPKSPKVNPGLGELLARQGGMPVPSLASPGHHHEGHAPEPTAPVEARPPTGPGVKMELHVRNANIIPTLEGFKTHALELNPRIAPFLLERISQDQMRRYKRLVKNKVDHKRSVELEQRCSSGKFCAAFGGEAELLPAKPGSKESNGNGAQYKVSNTGDSDGDEAVFDGVVTAALFPEGIPVPPTKRLPAKFECPLCFQVKDFQKPSDWTKHVHEDVQPFSCTFPDCPEPKSFKRKADWVRHENERHRHLEWWSCNLQDCTHVCYRKDNFVQHLVREHKQQEPKNKGRGSTSSKAKGKTGPVKGPRSEEQEFWQLVDGCRRESSVDPCSERCKFCDNSCNSWKRLNVHVGNHMLQIALPVLELAQRRVVSTDTVISPVETTPNMAATLRPDFGLLSVHPHSPHSGYQSSSAGQSPALVPLPPQGLVGSPYPSLYRAGMMVDGGPGTGGVNGYHEHQAYAHPLGWGELEGVAAHGQVGPRSSATTYPPAQTMRFGHPAAVGPIATDTGYGVTSDPNVSLPFYGGSYYSSPQTEQPYLADYSPSMMQNGQVNGLDDLSGMHSAVHATPADDGLGPGRGGAGSTSASFINQSYPYTQQPGTSRRGYF